MADGNDVLFIRRRRRHVVTLSRSCRHHRNSGMGPERRWSPTTWRRRLGYLARDFLGLSLESGLLRGGDWSLPARGFCDVVFVVHLSRLGRLHPPPCHWWVEMGGGGMAREK